MLSRMMTDLFNPLTVIWYIFPFISIHFKTSLLAAQASPIFKPFNTGTHFHQYDQTILLTLGRIRASDTFHEKGVKESTDGQRPYTFKDPCQGRAPHTNSTLH